MRFAGLGDGVGVGARVELPEVGPRIELKPSHKSCLLLGFCAFLVGVDVAEELSPGACACACACANGLPPPFLNLESMKINIVERDSGSRYF